MRPSLHYAFHPYLPERLGFRRLLALVNPQAAELLRKTDRHTLVVGRSRITLLRECRAVLRRSVPGDFVEFGVHKGGSAAVLASAIKNETSRELHLFDRWGDLPEPTDEDGFRKEQYTKSKIGEKLGALEGVKEEARHVIEEVVSFPKDRVHYYPGWYDDTLRNYPKRPIAFASIDCDYYESVKAVLGICECYASPGAVLVSDDYTAWPGAKRAIHEWLRTTRHNVQLELVSPMGTAVLRLMA